MGTKKGILKEERETEETNTARIRMDPRLSWNQNIRPTLRRKLFTLRIIIRKVFQSLKLGNIKYLDRIMGYQRERLSNYSKKSHDQQTLPITGLRISSLLSYSLHWLLPPCQRQAVTLSILPFIWVWLEIVLCLSVYRERAGLAVGVWLNNSGYWQARAGLLTSHIPTGDPQHRTPPLSEEGSASSPFEYILPHLVGQSFSIWPWQGHIPNGSHSIGVVQKWWRVKNQNISKLMA